MDDLCAVVVSSDTDYVQVCGLTTTLHIVYGSILTRYLILGLVESGSGLGTLPTPGRALA